MRHVLIYATLLPFLYEANIITKIQNPKPLLSAIEMSCVCQPLNDTLYSY